MPPAAPTTQASDHLLSKLIFVVDDDEDIGLVISKCAVSPLAFQTGG